MVYNSSFIYKIKRGVAITIILLRGSIKVNPCSFTWAIIVVWPYRNYQARSTAQLSKSVSRKLYFMSRAWWWPICCWRFHFFIVNRPLNDMVHACGTLPGGWRININSTPMRLKWTRHPTDHFLYLSLSLSPLIAGPSRWDGGVNVPFAHLSVHPVGEFLTQ